MVEGASDTRAVKYLYLLSAYIYIYTHTYIYIYTYRERDVYIYIYMERERERDVYTMICIMCLTRIVHSVVTYASPGGRWL